MARPAARPARLVPSALAIGAILCAGGAGLGAGCGGATTVRTTKAAASSDAKTEATDPVGRSCRRQGSATSKPRRAGGTGTGSTVLLAEWDDRTLAYVADGDDRAIHVVDVDGGDKLSTTLLDGTPGQLTLLPDGRLVATVPDRGRLYVLEPGAEPAAELELRCAVVTGAEPRGVALSGDGKRLVVTNGWGRSLQAYDTTDVKRLFEVELAREPRAVVLAADDRRAFVAHAVGGLLSVVDLDDRTVRTLSLVGRQDHEVEELRKRLKEELGADGTKLGALQRRKLVKVLREVEQELAKGERFPSGHIGVQSFALARSSRPAGRIFAPQVLVAPGNKEQRSAVYGQDHGQSQIPSVVVIDELTGYPMPTSLRVNMDLAYLGHREHQIEHCILPRAAAVDDETGSLLVGCFGTDVVVAYDGRSPDPAGAEKRRWRVPAGPSGVAVDPFDHRAVVWSQFERTVTVIPLGGPELELSPGEGQRGLRHIELPPTAGRGLDVTLALGRALFHGTQDGRIAKDGRACASCHPDGRDDGLVWASPNGPRRTPMLAGRVADTAPYFWDGSQAALPGQLQVHFERLRGLGGLRGIELRALLAYLRALEAPPSTGHGPRHPTQSRGAEIFRSKQAGCSHCHAGPPLTDGKAHDVKSKTTADRQPSFDTPSLRFVGGRAPYFHDGRYPTLRELLEDVDGKMGHTKHLSSDELDALEDYLESL
ncbi:MAG: cytochrome C peroxidase [Deltaproteobacteria bacterium]|nr:cytochrome C peroxidase [Deltaproteobacteria bacterium]